MACRTLVALAVALVLLAGCSAKPASPPPADGGTTSSGPAGPPPTQGPPAAPDGFAYACRGAPTPGSPVCSTLLLSPGHVLAEPFLAQDPAHPGTYALAANMRGTAADQALVGVALFASRDGGASWASANLPALPPGRSAADSILGDPALAFWPDGALAFGALLCGLDGACAIAAARSGDLGATWSPWQVISGGESADREWLTVLPGGALVADWTAGDSSVAVASSPDGLAWSPETRIPGCIGASPVEAVGSRAMVACVDFDGQAPQGVRLVAAAGAVGAAGGNAAWTPLDDQAGLRMVWPRVLPGRTGPALVLEDYANASVALREWDGIWGPLVDVRAALASDDGWTRAFCHAEAVDAWGRIHLIVGGEPAGPLAGPPDRSAMAYVHAVFDGGRLVHEQALTGDPPRQLAQLPAGQIVVSSDYAGLALDGAGGLLAWPEAGGLSLTRLSMG